MTQKIIILTLILGACNIEKTEKINPVCFSGRHDAKAVEISFDYFLKNSENLSDSLIQIEGYLHFNFEDVALYMTKKSSSNSALWIDFTSEVNKFEKSLNKMNGKRVKIIGIYRATNKGHFNSYKGSLSNIECITLQ